MTVGRSRKRATNIAILEKRLKDLTMQIREDQQGQSTGSTETSKAAESNVTGAGLTKKQIVDLIQNKKPTGELNKQKNKLINTKILLTG